MIIFRGLREDNKGIHISSLYKNEISVLCKIIDGYSGLSSYVTIMTLHPGVNYFFCHFVGVYHRRFEVWSVDETKLFLRMDIQNDGLPNLETLDTYGLLKNFKYENQKDENPALPLYEIFCNNLYDTPNCKVDPGDVVVDVGGNMGFFSYFAICKGAKSVFCFEPSKDCVKTIKNNFTFPNLIVEEAAVTGVNGEVIFYYDEDNSIQSSLHTPELGNGVTCSSINLNDYVLDTIDRINYLKIDCEGSEYDIIDSLSEEYLTNNIDKMCIEYHYNNDDRLLKMLEKIKKCGFHVESDKGGETIQGELGVFYAWK